MSELDGTQATPLLRPTTDNRDAWKIYWKDQGQPWRIEPEIDYERQKYLAGRRQNRTKYRTRHYPFKDVKLNRADVEWLLVTHENGRGPLQLE